MPIAIRLLVLWLSVCTAVPVIEESCTNYRKVSGSECADGCFAEKVGICPISVIAKAAKLDKGKCADAGFKVADGSTSQKAGPCGTLKFNKYTRAVDDILAVPVIEESCTNYRKVSGSECADGCFAEKVGICPISVIAKAAKLDKGKCADAGFKVADGSTSQKAGPCGTLKFNKYTRAVDDILTRAFDDILASEEPMRAPETACCKGACPAGEVKYFSVDVPHGFCGETCIKNWTYPIFKIFEANLTLATDDTPCPVQFTPTGTHYTNYTSTVTHGVFPLTVTLDLYAPGPTTR